MKKNNISAMSFEKQFSIHYPAQSISPSVIQFFDEDPNAIFSSLKETMEKEKMEDTRKVFVTDTNVLCLSSLKEFFKKIRESFDDVLVVIEAGEEHKTLQSVLEIVEAGIKSNMTRNTTFVGIGGGVVCDMTGFAASIFKRGTKCVFVPTTFLAMVDAAIGGKTGCDFDDYKNQIGTFFPAKVIFMFPSLVESLQDEQFYSGLAEALKTAFLFPEGLKDLFLQKEKEIKTRDTAIMQKIITLCCKAKARVVEEDFKEQGKRAYLNLGHTAGHALESVAGLGAISHGKAIAWGMSRAISLSYNLGLCKQEYKNEVISLLLQYGYEISPLPSCLEGKKYATEQLLFAMQKDKKNIDSSLRFVLQKDWGCTLTKSVETAQVQKIFGQQ